MNRANVQKILNEFCILQGSKLTIDLSNKQRRQCHDRNNDNQCQNGNSDSDSDTINEFNQYTNTESCSMNATKMALNVRKNNSSNSMKMACDSTQNCNRIIPYEYQHYHLKILPRPTGVYWGHGYEDTLYVSLALLNQNLEILQAYANKLPLMVVNASRLAYTFSAFEVFDSPTWPQFNRENNCNNVDPVLNTPASQAIRFYLEYEILRMEKSKAPNERFSQLLHRLKRPWSERYMFALATELRMNVDLIKSTGWIFRYSYRDPMHCQNDFMRNLQEENMQLNALKNYATQSEIQYQRGQRRLQSMVRRIQSNSTNTFLGQYNGVFTALKSKDGRWVVYVSRDPLLEYDECAEQQSSRQS